MDVLTWNRIADGLEAIRQELQALREERLRPATIMPPEDPAVRRFLEWFQGAYQARRMSPYLVKWAKHSKLTKGMLAATTEERLQMLAKIMLSSQCEDAFIVESDRGIEVLSAKFNWLSERLVAWEAKQKK